MWMTEQKCWLRVEFSGRMTLPVFLPWNWLSQNWYWLLIILVNKLLGIQFGVLLRGCLGSLQVRTARTVTIKNRIWRFRYNFKFSSHHFSAASPMFLHFELRSFRSFLSGLFWVRPYLTERRTRVSVFEGSGFCHWFVKSRKCSPNSRQMFTCNFLVAPFFFNMLKEMFNMLTFQKGILMIQLFDFCYTVQECDFFFLTFFPPLIIPARWHFL